MKMRQGMDIENIIQRQNFHSIAPCPKGLCVYIIMLIGLPGNRTSW